MPGDSGLFPCVPCSYQNSNASVLALQHECSRKSATWYNKKVLVTELTTLKTDGGLLDGGDHKDTYNHKLLQEMAKKEQQLEAEKKLQKIKDTKKWKGMEKMKQTKRTKKNGGRGERKGGCDNKCA